MATIWKRKDRDGWVVDFRDNTGQRVRLLAKTREEAEDRLAQKITESRQAAPTVTDQKITLSEYAERWLARVEPDLAPRTRSSYRQMLRLHLTPTFGPMRLRAIHRGHIKELLAHKRAEGLSKNTVRLIRATLSVLLADAVDDGILQINPAQGGARHGRKRAEALNQIERRKSIRAMSLEQLALFLKVAQVRASRRDWLLLLTLADTGTRPSEALALRWEDLDSAAGTLRVERALSGEGGQVKVPKTGESRLVEISPRLEDALGSWQVSQEAEAILRGRHPSPWIFQAEEGRVLTVKHIGDCFQSILRAAGLPRFRLYDLRHSYASHLLAEGAPITYVAAQLGHTKPTTTLLHYAHWLPIGDRGWALKLAQAREIGTKRWHQTASPAKDTHPNKQLGDPGPVKANQEREGASPKSSAALATSCAT